MHCRSSARTRASSISRRDTPGATGVSRRTSAQGAGELECWSCCSPTPGCPPAAHTQSAGLEAALLAGMPLDAVPAYIAARLAPWSRSRPAPRWSPGSCAAGPIAGPQGRSVCRRAGRRAGGAASTVDAPGGPGRQPGAAGGVAAARPRLRPAGRPGSGRDAWADGADPRSAGRPGGGRRRRRAPGRAGRRGHRPGWSPTTTSRPSARPRSSCDPLDPADATGLGRAGRRRDRGAGRATRRTHRTRATSPPSVRR